MIPAVVNTDTSAAAKSTNSMARSFTFRLTLRARRSLTVVGCMVFIEDDKAWVEFTGLSKVNPPDGEHHRG
jgi:hypothetical protein